MRHYEILFFVHPDQSTQVPSMVERYKNMVVEDGGIVHRQEDWGRRRLAHPVVKIHKAHYILLNIECDQRVIANLQNAFRFNDAVLRHLIVSVPEAKTEPSPIMKQLSEEAAQDSRQEQERSETVVSVAEDNKSSAVSSAVEEAPESTDKDADAAEETEKVEDQEPAPAPAQNEDNKENQE